MIAFWRHEDLEPGERLPNGEWRLACRAEPLSRLFLRDPPEAVSVHPAARRRARSAVAASAISVLAGAAAIFGLWHILPKAPPVLASWVPPAMENDFGDRLAHGVTRHSEVCHTPAGDAALHLLTDRLAASLPQSERPRYVLVVKLPVVNAQAFPGGNILIFHGLLTQARSADEVAGILGHEMSHVAARHALIGFIRGFGIDTLTTLVTGPGLLKNSTGVALANHYTRENEAEADAGAMRLLAAAGIGSDGFEDFFRRAAAKGGQPPGWLSDHPDTQTRAAAIHAHRLPPGTPALTPEQWAALQRICG